MIAQLVIVDTLSPIPLVTGLVVLQHEQRAPAFWEVYEKKCG